MEQLQLTFASEQQLSVRRFAVREALSTPFEVSVEAMSPDADLDLGAFVGKSASFRIHSGVTHLAGPARSWTGIVRHMEQIEPETAGLATYALVIVPALWRLGQRKNHRIFQHRTLPDIVLAILDDWGIEARLELGETYPELDYVVQYGDTDLAFVSRLLERAGITYAFAFEEGCELFLSDAPHARRAREGGVIQYASEPNEAAEEEFVTKVRLAHRVRPGRVTLCDHDFRRRPDAQLLATARPAAAPEDFYEQYRYVPGGFLVDRGGDVHDDDEGARRAERELAGERRARERVRYTTNCTDLAPGTIFAMTGHPRADLGPDQRLLVTETMLEGTSYGAWTFTGEATFARVPYRPELRTPKPRIHGVQSALVVGPPGEEIHTDEHGRVRVQFPWDREGTLDETSSCWIRVTQEWAGAGFGSMLLPRIGQEVLVAFLGGDPDRPVVVGRLYNGAAQVPHALPAHKTRSTWKSSSSPATGGFNEIYFEDRAGAEVVYLQAERDMRKLVKVAETERTGVNRTTVVGASRTEAIGATDTTLVGLRHVAQMMAPPPLGQLNVLEQTAPLVIPMPTTFDMFPGHLIFTTGLATVALGPNFISLEAKGDIHIEAKKGDVVLQGKKTFVNTKSPPPAPVPLPVVPPLGGS